MMPFRRYKPSLGYFNQAQICPSTAVFSAMDKDGTPVPRTVTGKRTLDKAVTSDGSPLPIQGNKCPVLVWTVVTPHCPCVNLNSIRMCGFETKCC